jgi:thiamine transporter ThiT
MLRLNSLSQRDYFLPGLAVEWISIFSWIIVNFIVAFNWLELGPVLWRVARANVEGVLAGSFLGISVYLFLYGVARFAGDNSQAAMLWTAVLNVVYHLVRWPLFFGLAATKNDSAVLFSFTIDTPLCVLFVILISIIVCCCGSCRLRHQESCSESV